MTTDVNEKLAQFLREGQNWEKKATSIRECFSRRKQHFIKWSQWLSPKVRFGVAYNF